MKRPSNLPAVRLSLRLKLAALVGGLLLGVAAFMSVFFPQRMDQMGHGWMQRKATAMASLLANAAGAGLEFDDEDSVTRSLRALAVAQDARWAAVYRPDGTRMAQWRGEKVTAIPPEKVSITKLTEVREDNGILVVQMPVEAKGGTHGALMMALSLEDVQREAADNRRVALLASLIVFLLGLAGANWAAKRIVAPLTELIRLTREVERGNLRVRVEAATDDEAGALAGAFASMVERLRKLLGDVGRLTHEVGGAAQQTRSFGTEAQRGATEVREAAGGTETVVGELVDSLARVAERVDALHSTSSRASEAIAEMERLNRVEAQSVRSMAAGVSRIGGTAKDVERSSMDVSARLDELNASLGQTSNAVSDLKHSIGGLGAAGQRAVEAGERAAQEARGGQDALRQTVEGIRAIEVAMQSSAKATLTLVEQVGRVDAIIGVISEMAGKTNLLALNADIVASADAAQGAAVRVIASEIRTLAVRARASAAEVTSLINQVRGSAQEAQRTLTDGYTRVAEGVKLGNTAGDALDRIVETTVRGNDAIREMDRLTQLQVHETTAASQATERVAALATQIGNLSRAHAAEMRGISEVTAELVRTAGQVENATTEQLRVSGQVAQVLTAVAAVVEQLRQARDNHRQVSGRLLSSARRIREVAEAQASGVADLQAAVEPLHHHVEQLEEQIRAVQA